MVELDPGNIWLKAYPVHYAGLDFSARMTVVRLPCGGLFLHSPCEIDHATAELLTSLGPVRFIVAPGSYHYKHVASAQAAFPAATT